MPSEIASSSGALSLAGEPSCVKVVQYDDALTAAFPPVLLVSDYLEKIRSMKLPSSLEYIKKDLEREKEGMIKHNPAAFKELHAGFFRMYGCLPELAREVVNIDYSRQIDWFERVARHTTTKPLTKVQEGLYNIYIFHWKGSIIDNMIRHTGVKFERRDKDPSDDSSHFLFDVQTWNAELQFAPMFRVQPKNFKERAAQKAVGVVYLSKGLIKTLEEMPTHTYTLLGNNCRDGVLSTITLCQFWNACLGIPQCINVTDTLKFMEEIFEGDKEILKSFGIDITAFNLRRRKQTEDLLRQLAEHLRYQRYDECLQKMIEEGIIRDPKKHPCASCCALM